MSSPEGPRLLARSIYGRAPELAALRGLIEDGADGGVLASGSSTISPPARSPWSRPA